jgi:hypothetical protein
VYWEYGHFPHHANGWKTFPATCTITNSLHRQEALARSSDDQKDILEELKVQAQILQVLVIGYKEFQDGTRVEPAYSQSVRTHGPQMEQSYQAAEDDLQAEGIDISAAKRHHALIKEWIDTVVNASTIGEHDHTSLIGEMSTLVEEPEAPVHAMNSVNITKNDGLPVRGGNATTKTTQDTTKSSEQSPSRPNKESKEPKELRSDREELILKRSESVKTHRSQASSWDHPDAPREDFTNSILSKVLKHKYPPQGDITIFLLPIKRAFHHLDWTGRGWLSRAQVEDVCLSAALHAGTAFERSEIALIVKAEDDKGRITNHHIAVEEFTNIVMTLQEHILAATIQRSGDGANLHCAKILKNWCNTAIDRSMFSTRWTERTISPAVKVSPPLASWGRRTNPVTPKPRPQPYTVYRHELGGDLPQGQCPLLGILTTIIHLATRHCTGRIDTALIQWRQHLLKSAPTERAEYIDALNMALQAASAFHALEDSYTPGIFHLVDDLLEIASALPAEALTGELAGCPVQDALHLQEQCWRLLFPILSFVNDLGAPAVRTEPPNMRRWRQMRMPVRAELIGKGVSSWQELSILMEKIYCWYVKNGPALRSKVAESIANALAKDQGERLRLTAIKSVQIQASIDKIPNPLFSEYLSREALSTARS